MVGSARWRWSDASSGRCEEALEERAGRLGAGGERIMVSERGGRRSPLPLENAPEPSFGLLIRPVEKTLTPEGFSQNTQQSSAAIADKFWGSD